MKFKRPCLVVLMLLLQPVQAAENPWQDKVEDAVVRAKRRATPAALRDALQVAWKADAWQEGLRLANWANEKFPNNTVLHGPVARALWRAGRVPAAEARAARIPADSQDPVALRTLVTMHLGQGDQALALELADRIMKLDRKDAEDYYAVFAARFSANKLAGLDDVVRRALRASGPDEGYPEQYVNEALEGLAEFLAAVGTEPFNQIAQAGSAEMTAMVVLNLPAVDVMINGRGPYRLIVDTGGSIMIALDQQVANELGLRSIAMSSVRGVGGVTESGQALIDELEIGTIRCRRVLTRTFDVRSAIMNAADGILGTGVFMHGRMTFDFVNTQLVVGPSSSAGAPGVEVPVRLVGDAKLMCPVTLEGEPAVALLDSGADVVALSPTRLKMLFPDREPLEFDVEIPVGVGAGEMPRITFGTGVKVQFGGRTLTNYSGLGLDVLDNTLGPVLGIQADLLMGMPTFREMRQCTVDYQRAKLWVEWLSAVQRNAPEHSPSGD